MRPPRQVWDALAQDERWLDDRQVDIVERIMREAFAAGYRAGVDGFRHPQREVRGEVRAVANGVKVLAARLACWPDDVEVLKRAWFHAAHGKPGPQQFVQPPLVVAQGTPR